MYVLENSKREKMKMMNWLSLESQEENFQKKNVD